MMKVSKEGKGDGGKAAGPVMFPRLHLTETKKAGPRGPPRNKMALYEQLTIPSHRYKPTPVPLPSSGRVMNTSMLTPLYQTQLPASSYDNMYSYMPMSYMNPIIPTMAYVPMMNVGVYDVGGGGGATATSSMNASSTKSTVVDAATESQRVPRGGEAVSRRQNSSGHSKPSAPSKKGKPHDDFAVPTYSATQTSCQTGASANPSRVQQGLRGGRGVQNGKELVTEKRSAACVDQGRRIRKEWSTEDDASWTSASVECVTVSAVEDYVNIQKRKVDWGRRDCDGGEVELNASGNRHERVKVQKMVGLTKEPNTTSSAGTPPDVIDSLRAVLAQQVFSGQSSENQSGELSEPSQPRRGSSAETELSMLENSASGSICFRDVVDAFGQQVFWKAQATIIRQQKLFARQVFELHRVIKVQRLFAKTSSLSLNIDEVLEEEEADNVSMPASPVADVPEVPEIPERGTELDGRHSSDEHSRPVPEAVRQPIYPLSVPSHQDYNAGSAWQATPFGANPWAARMSSPFTYVPYPSTNSQHVACSPDYGVYPTMDAAMSMYGNSGGMEGARVPLQNKTVKRARTEVPDSEVSPWFRIMSPSRRMMQQNGVIKVVPRAVSATPESAASILLSIQKERQC